MYPTLTYFVSIRGESVAVGRFQVMVTLQAARAYVLSPPLDLSKGWGLNRAISSQQRRRIQGEGG
jgi:hypothetical protein